MRRAGAVLLTALLVLVGAAACSDDDDGSSASTEPLTNDDVAQRICGALVDWNHVISEQSNEASDQVHDLPNDLDHSDEAIDALLGSLDNIQAETDDLVDTYEALDIPDAGEGGRMVAQLEEAVADVDKELGDVRDELEHDMDDNPPRIILSVYFPDMEKVLSVAQPDAPPEGDDLRAALDAEPTCDHVINR